ncbi:transposase [Paracoccus sp. Z330]|uniref:Transposase n=1 Tax=Paracoccus onchidii TaxID=3017813 RepID=A0ABT4ZHJ1_9RHOB|nr:transposase [Paracoccus onchidii]MDB6178729.1 transposase [Paracoccus onchidii]
MFTKRRKFTDQFKAKVAFEALRGDKTIQEIAARHQVHPNQVSTWKLRLSRDGRCVRWWRQTEGPYRGRGERTARPDREVGGRECFLSEGLKR